MPIEMLEDFGTNADGRMNEEYYKFCFQKGRFTEPDIIREQMIDKVVGFMVTQMKMSEPEAKKMAKTSIPKLKRWQSD